MSAAIDRFVFVDIETTGLNHMIELVLEIGVRITDRDLETIDDFDVLIWDTPKHDRKIRDLMANPATNAFVLDMHSDEKSGLFTAAQSEGVPEDEAERLVADFLRGHGVGPDTKEPMCGSSVQFDRLFLAEQFPVIHNLFSYRNIDTSTIKELCMRLNPKVYEQLEKYTSPQKRHRVLPDLTDTIDELGFYRDNFLYLP